MEQAKSIKLMKSLSIICRLRAKTAKTFWGGQINFGHSRWGSQQDANRTQIW